MTRFDTDTAVRPDGDGAFAARMDPGWWIVRGPNGGYVAAIVLRALTAAVGDETRAPRSLTLHFTAPPAEGAVRIEARVERSGRSVSAVSARLVQGDRLLAMALAAFGRPREAPAFADLAMPEVPPPEACPELERRIEIHDRYEMRWALGGLPFTGGDQALCGGWIRLREPRPVDPPLLAAYSDAMPPAIFSRVADDAIDGGVPTIDLTVHFRAPTPLPGARADDYTLLVFRSHEARDGFVDETGEIWSREGVLLAQSRQLAIVT
jgi:acyl-CoA thioesterase